MNYIIHANGTALPMQKHQYRLGNVTLQTLLTMKLLVFLTFCFSFQSIAAVKAQKVDLHVKNESFKSVIRTLQKQTGYSFIINEQYLRQARRVTIAISGTEILEVLPLLFRGQPFGYEVDANVVSVVPKTDPVVETLHATSLQDQITGRVTDSLGHPLEKATVKIKGTNRATFTDRDGRFTLRGVEDGAVLEISYLGYSPIELPATADLGTIILRSSQATLGEVEVVFSTGYQSLPKERATGSFTQIDNELFNRSVSTDLISRLEGVTNGLLFERPNTTDAPSSNPNLRIRGISTIRGESAPLIVVDNFPYEGDISNINPNDVESISVLKDAAAASIWGARAGNGVIVVTTKSGSISRKPTLSFNSNVNITDRPDLYYDRTYLPPADAVELERTLYGLGRYTKNDWTAYTPVIDILFARDEGLIDSETADSRLDDLKRYDIRDEAGKYLYRKSVNQQYALNINGGTDRNQYYISAGFDKSAEHLIGNSFARTTLNAKNDFQPLNGLNISSSISYMQNRLDNNGISMFALTPSGMNDVYVYARLADAYGNALPIVRNNRYTYTDNALAMGLLDWHYRPLDELTTNDNTSNSQEIRLNTAIRYNVLKGFAAEARYQYQNIGNSFRNHYSQDSYFARHEINRFTQVNGAHPIPLGGILDRSGNTFTSHYGRLQLDYNDNWGERHEINGLAGFEMRQEHLMGSGSSRLYGYNDEILTHVTNLDFNSSFPTRPRLSGRITNGNSTGNQTTDRFVSYYANLSYTYDGRYIFSGSTRWDASNIFGVAFNQKGVPLWSVGTAWNVAKEEFYKLDWMPSLKLRATYGANGNAVRSLSALPTISYASAPNTITGLPSGVLLNVGNPDLRWEKVEVLNFGLDFSILDNRVFGNIEWYNKNSSNLIGDDFLDPTTGIHFTGGSYNLHNRRNYADLKTTGFDIELNTINIDGALKWQTTYLFNYVKNRVTNYYAPPSIQAIDFMPLIASTPVKEGLPLEQLYAIPWNGLDATGAPLVMVNGELSTDYNAYFNNLTYEDLLQVGITVPPYFGSIRNTFSWHSLSLSFNILWRAGHKFRRESIRYNSLFGTSRVTHIDYLDRWQNAGDELTTIVPSMPTSTNLRRDQAYTFSDALIERGDNIRLQDINISYLLSSKYVNKAGLSQVRLYAYANNLGILWKHTKYEIDPDVRSAFPQPLQMAFGLQIQL